MSHPHPLPLKVVFLLFSDAYAMQMTRPHSVLIRQRAAEMTARHGGKQNCEMSAEKLRGSCKNLGRQAESQLTGSGKKKYGVERVDEAMKGWVNKEGLGREEGVAVGVEKDGIKSNRLQQRE